jgi:hypothetical protein
MGDFCVNCIYFCSCGKAKLKCKCCKDKKKNEKLNSDIFEYTSGESDSEFATPFNDLQTDEKSTRILFLWKKAFYRSRGGVLIVKKLLFQAKKIALFGDVYVE